jgi:hypothetical protein
MKYLTYSRMNGFNLVEGNDDWETAESSFNSEDVILLDTEEGLKENGMEIYNAIVKGIGDDK